MQAYLATGRTAEELIHDAAAGLAGRRADRVPGDEPGAGARPRATTRCCQPGGAEGGDRHRREQRADRAAPAGRRPGQPRRGCRRWSTRTPSRWARTSPPPRAGRAPHPGVRADPVRAADRDRVRASPLLIVPPTINKFYVARPRPRPQPRRALRRPGPAGVRDVLAQPGRPARRLGPGHLRPGGPRRAGRRRARSPARTSAHLLGTCSGGIISAHGRWPTWPPSAAGPGRRAHPAGHRARPGRGPAPSGRWSTSRRRPRRSPPRRASGYLDGTALAEVFAWLRPGDLVWNYWVNNYLPGKPPPAFDILFWNADTTRMTAALHRDFVDSRDGQHADPAGRRHAARHAGSTCPRSRSTPTWSPASPTTSARGSNCYRSTQLLGGDSRFVLSTNGHIAALVNPPGNPKSSYQVADRHPGRPAGLDHAREHRAGLVVAGLHALAGRALRRAGRGADVPRRPGSGRWPRPPAATCCDN